MLSTILCVGTCRHFRDARRSERGEHPRNVQAMLRLDEGIPEEAWRLREAIGGVHLFDRDHERRGRVHRRGESLHLWARRRSLLRCLSLVNGLEDIDNTRIFASYFLPATHRVLSTRVIIIILLSFLSHIIPRSHFHFMLHGS